MEKLKPQLTTADHRTRLGADADQPDSSRTLKISPGSYVAEGAAGAVAAVLGKGGWGHGDNCSRVAARAAMVTRDLV